MRLGPDGVGAEPGVGRHVCGDYVGDADRRARLREWIAEGLDRGERVGIMAGPGTGDGTAELGDLDTERLAAAGTLEFIPAAPVGHDGVLLADALLADLAARTAGALADGHRGYRYAGDATAYLVGAPARAAMLDYEWRLDALTACSPLSAMCALARPPGGDVVDLFAALHAEDGGDAPFHLFHLPGGRLALTGEVDLFSSALLVEALARAERLEPGVTAVLQAAGLGFLDHASLLALDRFAATTGGVLALRRAPAIVGRLVALLGVGHVTTSAT